MQREIDHIFGFQRILSILLVFMAGMCLCASGLAAGMYFEKVTPYAQDLPASLECTAAGQRWTWPVDAAEMVCVPAGNFEMGSEYEQDESPVHTVMLDAFWMDRTEVTNAMYAAFLSDQGNRYEGWSTWFLTMDVTDEKIKQKEGNWEVVRGFENHPVTTVSWYGARAYCTWVGKRLPTEAEWEKAAAGPDGWLYPWGEIWQDNLVNARGNSRYSQTAPVGSFPDGASYYGALDMAGNLAEWVADWYDPAYYQYSASQNPPGPENGKLRSIRGGSFIDTERECRASSRDGRTPAMLWSAYYTAGFRCAVDGP